MVHFICVYIGYIGHICTRGKKSSFVIPFFKSSSEFWSPS